MAEETIRLLKVIGGARYVLFVIALLLLADHPIQADIVLAAAFFISLVVIPMLKRSKPTESPNVEASVMSAAKVDLTEVPMTDLMDEIGRRSGASIIACIPMSSGLEPDGHQCCMSFRGDLRAIPSMMAAIVKTCSDQVGTTPQRLLDFGMQGVGGKFPDGAEWPTGGKVE